MNNFFNQFSLICDAPRPWGVYFQDSASPQMEALVELHDNIMFYLVIILFAVAWILISTMINYVNNKSPISNKYLNHGTLIELIWTITPALILIFIAFPSFKLLYLMDEVTDPSFTVFVEGHQWYLSYQYPDFLGDDDEELEFDSYLVPEPDLEDGELSNIEYEKSVVEMTSTDEIPDLDADADAVKNHEKIGKCVHIDCSSFVAVKQEEVTDTLCDFSAADGGRHNAFKYLGERVRLCNSCQAIFCNNCNIK